MTKTDLLKLTEKTVHTDVIATVKVKAQIVLTVVALLFYVYGTKMCYFKLQT